MNADKLFVFNWRLSAFIGGWVISSVFQGDRDFPSAAAI
jgi:hypothetical protein